MLGLKLVSRRCASKATSAHTKGNHPNSNWVSDQSRSPEVSFIEIG